MKRLGKVKTAAFAALAAVALAAPIAIAQQQGGTAGGDDQTKQRGEWGGKRGGGRRGGGRHFGGGRGMFRGVELTDDQKARLQTLRQEFSQRTQGLREQLRAKHMEIRQANEGGTFNESLATQKLTEAAALQAKLMGEEFRLRQDSMSVLTAEQRTQLEQRREQMKARRGERRGRRNQQPQQEWQ
ncbi:MAG TPA: Spy/CpxP family protein refolding chaperone [Pyrinomonadaceae bacterium]|nr:Spy/CpxP family protein refolding chaperone [Pyrinomonadaceae bacterium]